LLPSPSFAFDGARTPPEELVNSASAAAPCGGFERINQPDPIFPQSPGIISQRTTSILLFAVRDVLSMNCKHHIKVSEIAQQLICTTYPPKTAGEQAVDNADSLLKSMLLKIRGLSYSPKNDHQNQVVNKSHLEI
jgi:hypothetical protein